MVILIDLIIVGIILLITLISAKQGFVRTIVGAVGFIAAVVIAFTLSEPLANATYDRFIEPPIVNSVGDTATGSVNENVDKLWDSIPSFITDNSAEFGFTKESIKDSLSGGTQESVKDAVAEVSQKAVKPVFCEILGTVYAVILVILLMIIVRLLARLLNKLFSFSIVGRLNTALGGVIGFVKGLVIALILCEIIVLIISFTDNGIWIFNNENIDKTYIFKFLTNVF